MDSEVLALLRRIGYPEAWLAEAAAYTPRDAYTVFDPRWADEVPEIPETTVDVIVQRQAQLLAHPGITDAAVIGEPHPYRGEVPVAFVVGTVLPDEVVSYCRERLAAIKVPARVVVLEQLPKNTMGKTLKRTLRTTGSDG